MARIVAVATLVGMMGTFQTEARVTRRALNDRVSHFEFVDIKEHHIFRRSLGHETSGDQRHIQPFTLPVKMFNRSMDLKLKPAQHLFMDGATIHVDGTTKPLNGVGLYTGVIHENDRFNHVHLKIEEDGTIQGIIVDGGDAYHIDPVADHFDSPQEADHVVYREADMVYIKSEHKVDETLAHSSKRTRREGEEDAEEAGSTASAKVRASPYQEGHNTCHMGLWADKSFVDQFGGTNAAVVKMLQRFSISQKVYETTNVPGITGSPLISIQRLIVDANADFSKYKTPTAYLEAFSEKYVADPANPGGPTDRDWADVCLAHAFTNQDYDGTLGLAWTAYPNKNNHNGGICQSQYRDGSGADTSLNTGFSTTLNFGSQQPELQTTLVMVHEIGHNFGSPHDLTPGEGGYTDPGAGGVNVMYPYAPSGGASNNDEFSAKSAEHISESMLDRAGCFLNEDGQTGTCGNFVKDGDDECDCGGTEASCLAFDPNLSCTATCTLREGCECSPLDSTNGLCCSSDDADYCKNKAAVCHEMDSCMAEASCAAGECPDAAPRQENALCQDGVSQCTASSGCAGLCDATGTCSKSICSLWGLGECTSNFGEAEGCMIMCAKADGSGCDTVADLEDAMPATGSVVAWDPTTTSEVAFTDFAGLSTKTAGAQCAHFENQLASGICDKDAQCLAADNEEDALGELYAQYNYLKNTFQDWANDDTSGIPNYAWFIIGAFLVLFLCCGLCWRCNKENVVEVQSRMKRKMSRA